MTSKGEKNKPDFTVQIRNFIVWLFKKIFDHLLLIIITSLVTPITIYFIFVKFSIIRNSIQLPIYLVVILISFAAAGLILILSKYVFPLFKKKTISLTLPDENLEIEWRTKCYYDGTKRHFEDPTIYCTRHKLKMVTTLTNDILDPIYIAICFDCVAEHIRKSSDPKVPDGVIHICSNRTYDEYVTLINNYFERELEQHNHNS
jgi:hypothetical protein